MTRLDVIALAEKILRSYGDVLADATEQKYPGMVYPQSLLPYSKDAISTAIAIAAKNTKDKYVLQQLANVLQMLEQFIDDEEAEKRNNEMRGTFTEINKFADELGINPGKRFTV